MKKGRLKEMNLTVKIGKNVMQVIIPGAFSLFSECFIPQIRQDTIIKSTSIKLRFILLDIYQVLVLHYQNIAIKERLRPNRFFILDWKNFKVLSSCTSH